VVVDGEGGGVRNGAAKTLVQIYVVQVRKERETLQQSKCRVDFEENENVRRKMGGEKGERESGREKLFPKFDGVMLYI
jgi:hypothetical protein